MSAIKESAKISTTEEGLRTLVADNETIIRTFRHAAQEADEVDDIVTADMLTKRMGVHEKAGWMLRSLLAN
jgi:starvation-inducible DNA-binding protein